MFVHIIFNRRTYISNHILMQFKQFCLNVATFLFYTIYWTSVKFTEHILVFGNQHIIPFICADKLAWMELLYSKCTNTRGPCSKRKTWSFASTILNFKCISNYTSLANYMHIKLEEPMGIYIHASAILSWL